jgi:hypothetical protein
MLVIFILIIIGLIAFINYIGDKQVEKKNFLQNIFIKSKIKIPDNIQINKETIIDQLRNYHDFIIQNIKDYPEKDYPENDYININDKYFLYNNQNTIKLYKKQNKDEFIFNFKSEQLTVYQKFFSLQKNNYIFHKLDINILNNLYKILNEEIIIPLQKIIIKNIIENIELDYGNKSVIINRKTKTILIKEETKKYEFNYDFFDGIDNSELMNIIIFLNDYIRKTSLKILYNIINKLSLMTPAVINHEKIFFFLTKQNEKIQLSQKNISQKNSLLMLEFNDKTFEIHDEEFLKFFPDITEYSKLSSEQLMIMVNFFKDLFNDFMISYKNTIKYNIDFLFKELNNVNLKTLTLSYENENKNIIFEKLPHILYKNNFFIKLTKGKKKSKKNFFILTNEAIIDHSKKYFSYGPIYNYAKETYQLFINSNENFEKANNSIDKSQEKLYQDHQSFEEKDLTESQNKANHYKPQMKTIIEILKNKDQDEEALIQYKDSFKIKKILKIIKKLTFFIDLLMIEKNKKISEIIDFFYKIKEKILLNQKKIITYNKDPYNGHLFSINYNDETNCLTILKSKDMIIEIFDFKNLLWDLNNPEESFIDNTIDESKIHFNELTYYQLSYIFNLLTCINNYREDFVNLKKKKLQDISNI